MNIATKHEPARLSLAPLALPSAWADRTVLLVGAAMLLRLLVASTTGLSDTEAYYAQWARVPALSYYDHPPLVAWTTWIVQRLSTAPWAVRVGPILYAAAFSGLLYRLGARLFSPRAGFLAVALVTAIPAIAASTRSSLPPASKNIPTSCPRALCSPARSITCLNRPPSGARNTWTILSLDPFTRPSASGRLPPVRPLSRKIAPEPLSCRRAGPRN